MNYIQLDESVPYNYLQYYTWIPENYEYCYVDGYGRIYADKTGTVKINGRYSLNKKILVVIKLTIIK